MNRALTMDNERTSLDEMLQTELGRADALVGSLGGILRHLLANDDHSMFSDEIIARLRGMIANLAQQLLFARARAANVDNPASQSDDDRAALEDLLLSHLPLLGHVHAVALEFQLTSRLEHRQSIDPVLTPLVQSLVASPDGGTANAAMAALAAQARFMQQQRRMELPLAELPGDLFHSAVLALRSLSGEQADPSAERASETLRKGFDESSSRVGLLSRLVMGLGSEAARALEIEHAGVAFFVTALGIASGQDRDLAILSTNDRQTVRLALSLRAAGVKPEAIAEQFAFIHPAIALPADFGRLRNDRACELLAASNADIGG